MRSSRPSAILACSILLCLLTVAIARPQGGEPWRSSPWWKQAPPSQSLSANAIQATHDEPQLSPRIDLDLRLGQPLQTSSQSSGQNTPHPEDSRYGQRTAVASYPSRGEPSIRNSIVYTGDVPMTLHERQQARQDLWYTPGRPHLVRIAEPSNQQQLSHRSPTSQVMQFQGAGTSAAPVIIGDEESDLIANHLLVQDPSLAESSRPFPREAAEGRFEFRTYNYDEPGLQHLMKPKLVPRSMLTHIHSSRGATRVYRPDPDVLRAIETFISIRVGNEGVFARRSNGERSVYGTFLQPLFVEEVSMNHLVEAYRLQPIGFDKFLTIHPAAMQRAASAVTGFKKTAKTVYFPTIRVNNVNHYIMAVPQSTKFPINRHRVSGVMFHFWEGLAPVNYGPDFPTFRAYLGAMMLDQDRFDKWTDISRLNTATWTHTLGHT